MKTNLHKTLKKSFGSGPYNPLRYKGHFVKTAYPTREEISNAILEDLTIPSNPIRNLRHVNPVRQSGPLPPHSGPYTMEDVRSVFLDTTIGPDQDGIHTHPEEIMRRVPGITRKEAEHITTLGLNPKEEVDYAYIAYNTGLDVFYPPNAVYIARQVVSNSKGEKVECYWNTQSYEEMAFVNVGHAPTFEQVDYTWEIFLWGELAIHPLVEFDLSVPQTWFEYEEEAWMDTAMQLDQITLPEDLRKPSSKHPNCSKELFYSQQDLDRFQEMKDPEWVPTGLKRNVYNEGQFVADRAQLENNDRRIC